MDPVKWNTTVGTEVWRGAFTGGERVTTLVHAHNKYLNGVTEGNEHYLVTSADFPDFQLEGSDYLNRSIILNCVSGDGVQYDFSFPYAGPGV